MLFHSQAFLLAFLPVTLAAYYALAWREAAGRERDSELLGGMRRWTMIAASLVFYGYWDWRLIPLLVGSVVVNWLLSLTPPRLPMRAVVAIGVTANLALLGLFKYADFAIGSVEAVLGLKHDPFGIVLPLGISFFTFQQISYLVDLGRGTAPRYRFADYALWVVLFPHLIAGPIIRHHEIIDQFALHPLRAGWQERIARGAVLLTLGIAKKVMIADPLARLADPVFQAAAAGKVVGLVDGWCAGLSFALQIYFDFSGYSDMAMGIGLVLGLMLPVNFLAPYRATSIRDFWRRWHMTLSRFLRDYLYTPLGGNRLGAAGRFGATLATMLLGGLWHGAAWTFVAWGALHGLALAVNQWWATTNRRFPTALGWLLTVLIVVIGFVVFRATSFTAAAEVLGGMAGLHGKGALMSGQGARDWWMIPIGGVLALVGPTAHQLVLERLKPSPWVATLVALLFVYLLLAVGEGKNTEFIYFQF